jgi:elongation factor Ts
MLNCIRRSFGKVSTDQIRLLRDMTGAPLLQCKNILIECDGDVDKAKEVLREKNLIFADKKAGASACEGVDKGLYSFGDF